MGQSLKILASAYFGVQDVEGRLNVSPDVLVGVPSIAILSCICHRRIPFHSQFVRVDQGLKILAGVHFGLADVGGLHVPLVV